MLVGSFIGGVKQPRINRTDELCVLWCCCAVPLVSLLVAFSFFFCFFFSPPGRRFPVAVLCSLWVS